MSIPQNGVAAAHSLTYHIFAMVVSRCLPCRYKEEYDKILSINVVLTNCWSFPSRSARCILSFRASFEVAEGLVLTILRY